MSANSDPETAAACSTVLRRVLRQHPSTAGKTATMNLPGAQERAIIACISQVSCHSDNFIRSKSTAYIKIKRAIQYKIN